MRWQTFVKVGGGIMIVSINIVSYILDAQGIAQIANYDIPWRCFFLGGFLVFAIYVGWIIYDLNHRLQAILNAQPNLVISNIEQHNTTIRIVDPKTDVDFGKPSFTRIWVANYPKTPEKGIIAESVYAEIIFHNQSKQKLFVINGKWAEGGQPALGAGSLQTQQMTIPPNRKPFCLDIGLKYLMDDNFYGIDDETTLVYSDWRNPKYKLNKGIYLVQVTFACKGANSPIWFKLENLGKGHDVNFCVLED